MIHWLPVTIPTEKLKQSSDLCQKTGLQRKKVKDDHVAHYTRVY